MREPPRPALSSLCHTPILYTPIPTQLPPQAQQSPNTARASPAGAPGLQTAAVRIAQRPAAGATLACVAGCWRAPLPHPTSAKQPPTGTNDVANIARPIGAARPAPPLTDLAAPSPAAARPTRPPGRPHRALPSRWQPPRRRIQSA
jgi:hypothetical protein